MKIRRKKEGSVSGFNVIVRFHGIIVSIGNNYYQGYLEGSVFTDSVDDAQFKDCRFPTQSLRRLIRPSRFVQYRSRDGRMHRRRDMYLNRPRFAGDSMCFKGQ